MAEPRTVTLEWRGDDYQVNKRCAGFISPRGDGRFAAWLTPTDDRAELIDLNYPTRPAAMRAVEAAVMRALGAEGGGDANQS